MYISLTLVFRALGISAFFAGALAFLAFSLWAAIPIACSGLVVAVLAFMVASLSARLDRQQEQIVRLAKELKGHTSKPGH